MSVFPVQQPEPSLRKKLRYARQGTGGLFILLAAVFLLKVMFGKHATMEDRLEIGALSFIFLALGSGILFASPHLVSRGISFIKLMQEHPEEPWKWREDWVRGTIDSGGQFKVLIPWVLGFYIVVLSSESLMRHGVAVLRQDPVEIAMSVVR